jgi:hypothetical protein
MKRTPTFLPAIEDPSWPRLGHMLPEKRRERERERERNMCGLEGKRGVRENEGEGETGRLRVRERSGG